ncbi:MAG TPA: hypothetical protein GXX18_01690 [Bacillales bacterium]|nr:hypothetical protein [Bacillales bacterium]
MQLLHLNISSQFAKLGIHSQRPGLEIKQPPADLQLRQPQPDLTMTKTKGKLEIDQSEAFADANLKPPLRRTKEAAEQSKEKLLQDLAQKANEGRRLMKIETKNKNTIAQIAREHSEPKQKQFNIGFVPESATKVKFHYTPSEIDINVNLDKAIVKAKPNKPIIKYHKGDIQIYLRQKPSIEFNVTASKYDLNI